MNTINKKEAQEQLEKLKADVARLEAVINAPEDIKERIKQAKDPMEVIYQLAGTTKCEFEAKCAGDTIDEIGWKEVKMIAKVLNEGSAVENNHYYPAFKKTSSGFVCDCYFNGWSVVSPLAKYKDAATAIFAGQTLEASYNKWYGFKK